MAGDHEAKAFGRALGWLEDLIRAGHDGPVAIRATLEDQLQQAVATVETLAYAPATVPMTAEFAKAEVASSTPETVTTGRLQGTGGGRRLILFAHPDTEPFAPEPAWQSDIFTATHRDGRLHGWGAADDLAGTAMLAAAAAMVQATGCRLQDELILVAAPSKRHRRGIGAALHAGLTGDAALYLHPAESGRGLGEIKAFASGQLEFTITVEGAPPATSEPAHTAFAHRGDKPIAKAAKVMAALDAYDQRRAAALHHTRLETAIGRSTNLMVTHINAGAADVTTRLPEACTLRAALSLVPGEVLDDVMRELEVVMAETAAADPWLSAHPPRIDCSPVSVPPRRRTTTPSTGSSKARSRAPVPGLRSIRCIPRATSAIPLSRPEFRPWTSAPSVAGSRWPAGRMSGSTSPTSAVALPWNKLVQPMMPSNWSGKSRARKSA